jgi:hypothetical protein
MSHEPVDPAIERMINQFELLFTRAHGDSLRDELADLLIRAGSSGANVDPYLDRFDANGLRNACRRAFFVLHMVRIYLDEHASDETATLDDILTIALEKP